MSTLSPVGRSGGGPGRHLRTALVLLVGLAALVAAGFVGWTLAGRDNTTGASGPSPSVSTSASCTPSARPSPTATRTHASSSRSVKAHPSSTALPKPKTITVNVYNSTSRSGLAHTTATQLAARGFTIGSIGNDSAPQPVMGVAEVRYGPHGVAQARVVAAQVPGAKLVEDHRRTADVDLAVGAKYKHLATPAQVKAALSPAAKPSPSC